MSNEQSIHNILEKIREIERHAEIEIKSPRQAVMEAIGKGPVGSVPELMWTATAVFFIFRPRFVEVTVDFQERTFVKLIDAMYDEYQRQK